MISGLAISSLGLVMSVSIATSADNTQNSGDSNKWVYEEVRSVAVATIKNEGGSLFYIQCSNNTDDMGPSFGYQPSNATNSFFGQKYNVIISVGAERFQFEVLRAEYKPLNKEQATSLDKLAEAMTNISVKVFTVEVPKLNTKEDFSLSDARSALLYEGLRITQDCLPQITGTPEAQAGVSGQSVPSDRGETVNIVNQTVDCNAPNGKIVRLTPGVCASVGGTVRPGPVQCRTSNGAVNQLDTATCQSIGGQIITGYPSAPAQVSRATAAPSPPPTTLAEHSNIKVFPPAPVIGPQPTQEAKELATQFDDDVTKDPFTGWARHCRYFGGSETLAQRIQLGTRVYRENSERETDWCNKNLEWYNEESKFRKMAADPKYRAQVEREQVDEQQRQKERERIRTLINQGIDPCPGVTCMPNAVTFRSSQICGSRGAINMYWLMQKWEEKKECVCVTIQRTVSCE